MKKWLIASSISIIPLFYLGIINPIFTLLGAASVKVNTNVFWIYTIILLISLSVVFTSTLFMIKYTSKIDTLEDEQSKVSQERERLATLIRHYNNLVENLTK
jgi:heme/copper-type cytochrome/quinol oxidase subunit 2